MYGIDTQIWMDPIRLEIREAPMEISPDHLKLLSALVWILYDFSNISYAFPSLNVGMTSVSMGTYFIIH